MARFEIKRSQPLDLTCRVETKVTFLGIESKTAPDFFALFYTIEDITGGNANTIRFRFHRKSTGNFEMTPNTIIIPAGKKLSVTLVPNMPNTRNGDKIAIYLSYYLFKL